MPILRKIHSAYFIGEGCITDMMQTIEAYRYHDEEEEDSSAKNSVIIMINDEISPAQQRNLHQKLGCDIEGKTGLFYVFLLNVLNQRRDDYKCFSTL